MTGDINTYLLNSKEPDAWTELQNMALRDPEAFERFGASVSQDHLLVAIWTLLGRVIREQAGKEQGPAIITLGTH